VLQRKSETGRVIAASGQLDIAGAVPRLDAIKKTLSELSVDGQPTFLLIHTKLDDGRLRSWLIGPDGAIAKADSSEAYDGIGYINDGIGVTALAASRGPRAEGQPALSDEEAEALLAADLTKEAVVSRFSTLARARDQLLPGAVGEALGSHKGRLLIASAFDTGTAPYPAMFLRNGRAVLNWSFLVLPDLDVMTSPSGSFDYRDLKLSNAVIVGDPDLTDDRIYDWSGLPGAREEAAEVAEIIGADRSKVMIGKAATRRSFTAAIQRTPDLGLVYMATHAVSNKENPLTRGFMAMSGGHYYAGHIRQEQFPAWKDHEPLVVMSACQTALGRMFDAGGFGVARAWTTAGAGQVVASLWNVSDLATRLQMERFMFYLNAGDAPEIALQKAQIDTMNHVDEEGRKPYLNNPKMWASFSIYGKPSS
jgi:hypothetical protein